MPFDIEVGKEYDGVSPKSFLKKKLDVAYSRLPKLLRDKRITLNKKRIKKDSVLRSGDIVRVWLDDIKLREEKRNFEKSEDLGIPVIYENEDFFVFNKPAGVVVQGAQDNDKSLSLHLAFLKRQNKDDDSFEYKHVHRLDKDTTGVLLVAKNIFALRDLNEIFRTKNIVKKYWCLCSGRFDHKEGKVSLFLKRTPEGSREKVMVAKEGESGARKTLSLYKVLEEYKFRDEDFSLVEVELKSGFTHQIRFHMKYLGCPVVGDRMYGNSFVNGIFDRVLMRQFLHAKSLSFDYKGKSYAFEADLSEDLKSVLKMICKR